MTSGPEAKLEDLPGIGKDLAGKLKTIVETGDLQGDSDKKLLQSLLTGPNAMKKVYDSDGVILAARGN